MVKTNEYYLGLDEVNLIVAAAKNLKESVILKILAGTGMRRFELANLMVKDVDFERKRLFIAHGKGHSPEKPKSRAVPIDEDLVQTIKFYLDGRRTGFLIQSNKKSFEGISLSQINRIVTNAAKRAKISNPNPQLKNINPHIFRHSFVRISLANGIPFNAVQKIVGHMDARTTLQMYGQASFDDVQEIYNAKLAGLFSQKPKKNNAKLSQFSDKTQSDNI
jgi:integrase/recombinase XerD